MKICSATAETHMRTDRLTDRQPDQNQYGATPHNNVYQFGENYIYIELIYENNFYYQTIKKTYFAQQLQVLLNHVFLTHQLYLYA